MDFPTHFDDGIEAHLTSRGHCLVTIRWWAQANRRNRKWFDAMRARHESEFEFDQEFGINWNARSGDAYFPEFIRRGSKFFTIPSPGVYSDLPVFRGWDFGTSRPAVVWGQIDETGRVWVLREIAPTNIDIHQFRDLVLYLSGQLDIEEIERRCMTRALQIINEINDPESGYPPTPWFEGSLRQWIDHGLPEAVRPSTIVTTTERTDADVLASGGIYLQTAYVHLERREQVMRALLRLRPDGRPGIIWDPACKQSLRMMNGGLTRRKDKKTGRTFGSEYNKPGLVDDLYDAHSAWLTQEIDPADFAADGTIRRTQEIGEIDSYWNNVNDAA